MASIKVTKSMVKDCEKFVNFAYELSDAVGKDCGFNDGVPLPTNMAIKAYAAKLWFANKAVKVREDKHEIN